ncbi:Polycystic kidney disease 1 like 1 Protein abecobe [Larimichthys crocea]|uniref:Polycystic kidney disease 1 like 1 Protein abecobe n=1 Tax=Larimichthys crocea TaxID=215358 RepID=A0A6G0HLK3_LARCR|nr:Polycystic kidney disease 1 like 1 Protein abecobe [Larimichthys crocea]
MNMFRVFVFTLVSLHPFSHRFSVAVSATHQENSPWFTGCVKAGSRLYAPKGARDLDPVTCSVRCLDEGYQVAALTSEACYCGNQQHGLVASECVNTSTTGGTMDVRGESKSVLSLPVGVGQESVALYRTEGPFLHSVRLSTSPDRVHAGKTFVVEVSGNLAGRPGQPSGILGLGGQDLSYVTVEIHETTHKGQRSHRVSVLDDGSFVVSSAWTLETPGKYELNVSVSNPLSTLCSILHLSVLQPSPHSLVISVLHGPLGVPDCIPFLPTDSNSVTVEAAYLGDPVTLQADMSDSLPVEFSWWFKGKNMECVKTVCLSNSHCLNSTVVAVRPAVSDLRVSVSEHLLTSGEVVSVFVELFTTMKHLLILSLTLNSEHSSTNLSNITECNFSKDNGNISTSNTANINKAGDHLSEMTHRESSNDHNCNNSNRGNISYDHNLLQNHNNNCCHDGTHLYLRSDTQLRICNCSSCHLHLQLRCCLPTTAEQYHLRVSVLSTSDPSSVLLSTALPRALMVYKHIHVLRPSGSWKSAVSTHTEFSLEVFSPASRLGLRVIWTFSLDDVIVMSRTTEEWNLNASLTIAGCYKVTVEAFNPISRASFCTQILVQDPVGELVLNVPSVITTHQKHSVLFGVTAGSNVTVSLLVNATLLFRNSSYAAGGEAAMVLLFNRTGTVVVELRAENGVSSQSKSVRVCVERNRKPQVKVNLTWQPSTSPVHSLVNNEKQAYPTNTDITFLAVAEVPDPVEFLWHFGDSGSVRTTSRTVTRRYHKPGRYAVFVVLSSGRTSLTSDVFPLVVQRAVTLNRLLHQASVLLNQTVKLSCRLNVGTDVSFLWDFGDGSHRLGQSTEQHVFHRTGEFTVTVTVSNLVSSATLSSHIFVVDRPCQPPPVKNMGPLKLQVRRYESIRLGVTYETEVDCDISGGLHYTWTLFDSAGRVFPLPLIDTHRQSLVLPSHLLHYDTYSAIARVQVNGSVVYSNYSVRVQVIPSPPVAVIQGGTNIFINNRNTTVVTLDGQRSYDPDSPMSLLSFSWTCKPVSSITSSCFHQDVPTSSPVLAFPASFLKHNFDQFQLTLTIHSGRCQFTALGAKGDEVNWDQSFSVSALCEGCGIPPKDIQYTWSLYLVNASSKPVIDVPFCYTVDLSAPSSIMEGPATSPQTPLTSTLHAPATDALQYTSAPIFLIENAAETRAKKQHLNEIDSITLSKSTMAGEEPFYHPLGEFDPPELLYSSTEYQPLALDNSGVLFSDQSDVISEFPVDLDSSADWEFSFPVLESGDLGGRLGVDGESFNPGDDSLFDSALHEDQGSNLVDSRPSVVIQQPILLDLPRDQDLVYEYSITVGDKPRRVLYQGRDFQYYSSLPSGDPDDDYKVTIHTVIRSSTYGTATKPCPVTVRVQPGFFRDNSSSSRLDPDLELSESGLRNLSALVQLGNIVEVRNYISLISSILNRLSLDTEANTRAQRCTRNVLICTACELKSREQVSLASARRVTIHVQVISEHFPESSAPVLYNLDQKTLNTLVALLSYSLQTAVTGNNLALEMSNSVEIKQALESGSHEENIRNVIAPSNGSIPDSSSGVYIKRRGSISTKQAVQLVADILQTASDLMLKYILFHEDSGAQSQHSRKTESRPHRPCALRILTELTHSPYTWAHYPGGLSGPVVDLSLYECSTRRKIPVRSLIQPINIELQQPPRNKSSVHEHVLWRSQVNYHSFNITQEHLQQAIQLSVVFSAPLNKPFPIMLLFRMFKRPTPSMHHLHRIHHWESNTTRFTLPSSYLSAAGVGHLALLNADFGKVPRHKHLSEQVSYSLTVDSSLCLSWDAHQGAWTHYGCRTQQADKTTAANCSCHQLRPLTVVQRQIPSSHDTTDLDPFLSVSSDLTVLGVLVLCVCLYIPGLVLCKRADVISKANQRVHYLPDNSPRDPYLYAVTIYTGPCSAACMSAK